jgi:hypothetical protein
MSYRRRTLAALLVAASGAASACDDDLTGPGEVVGTYQLVAVQGKAVPFTEANPGGGFRVVSGATLTLREDRTYVVTQTIGTVPTLGNVQSAVQPATYSGIYQRSGDVLVFLDLPPLAALDREARFEAGTVRFTGAAQYVYRR